MDTRKGSADAPRATSQLHHLTLQPVSQPRPNRTIDFRQTADAGTNYWLRIRHSAQQSPGHATQLIHRRMTEPAPEALARKTAPRNEIDTSLLNYHERLTQFIAEVSKPPPYSSPSSGSTTEDTEEDHEAALKLCLGSRNSSSTHERNDLLAQGQQNLECISGKSHVEASFALSVPLAGSTTRSMSIAGYHSCTHPSSDLDMNITSMLQAKDNIPATAAPSSFEPTTSSKSPLSAKRILPPATARIDSTPLRGQKRSCLDVFERCAEQDSKRFRTASTSPERKCSISAKTSTEDYITFLQRQAEQTSTYISSRPVPTPNTIAQSSDPCIATGNPRSDTQPGSVGNQTGWWNIVMSQTCDQEKN